MLDFRLQPKLKEAIENIPGKNKKFNQKSLAVFEQAAISLVLEGMLSENIIKMLTDLYNASVLK